MSLDRIANTFSQRSGIERSMMSTIISSVISHLTQQDSQRGEAEGVQSALSNIGPLSACTTSTTRHWYPRSPAGHTLHTTGCRLNE
jgi:hypothetical protein